MIQYSLAIVASALINADPLKIKDTTNLLQKNE